MTVTHGGMAIYGTISYDMKAGGGGVMTTAVQSGGHTAVGMIGHDYHITK